MKDYVNIAIVGGGPGCKALLELFERSQMTELKVNILGVAEIKPASPGYIYAMQKGFPTCNDYRDLLELKGLDLIIELTGNGEVLEDIVRTKPATVRVMDHVIARLFWDLIQFDEKRTQFQQKYLAQKNLSEERKKYETLVENIKDLVFSLDLKGTINYVNPAAKDLLGYSMEELIGKPFSDLLIPPYDQVVKDLLAVAAGGYCFQCKFRGKLGNERTMQLSAHALIRDGIKWGLSGIAHDITERIRSESNLIRSNRIFKAIHELTLDVNKNPVDFLNALCEKVEQLFGADHVVLTECREGVCSLKASSSLPSAIVEYYRIDIDSCPCSEVARHGQILETNLSASPKYSLISNKLGINYYLGIPLLSSTGELTGVLGYYSRKQTSFRPDDLRLFEIFGQRAGIELERERREKEKEELKEQLFQSQKMEAIGTLAGGIAHDFNNLLSGILGYASYGKMLLPENHPVRMHLEVIERSAERSAELVQQMLGFSRGGKYEVKPVNCNDIVEEAVKLLSRTIDKAISLETRLCPDLPLILADAVQIQQVILNLCINARDAMPQGGRLILDTQSVTIDEFDSRKHLGAKPGRYVVVNITDTGVGIDQNIRRRIFEPFFTTKDKGKGTGLGLAMVYGIVKNHGGHISFQSEKGNGTHFTVFFPAADESATIVNHPDKVEIPGGNETILLIDDEDTIRELGKEVLETLGYSVVLAADGMEAVGLYTEMKGKIDLIILDIVMPRIGGKETFKKLKSMNPDVKVIISSGYSIDGEAQEILNSGASAFIQKPYKITEISLLIRRVLESAPAAKT